MASSATVVVVGGGLAGLSSALTAARHGAEVFLLEKEKGVGGNSAKATSGINGVRTPAQAAAGIEDSEELFRADTLSSGHGHCKPALVDTLATHAGDAVAWLKTFGVPLDAVVQCGGHSLPRTHHEPARPDGKPAPVGWDIIAALKKAAEATPNIHIVTGAEAIALMQGADTPSSVTPLHHRGALPVVGVRFVRTTPSAEAGAPPAHEEATQRADAVILATGGFGNDHTASSLLAEFAPQLAGLPTTNGAFARGDGVRLARAAGAYLEGMEHVQVHPTAFVDPADPTARTKFLGPEALRGYGGILLNHRGRRFVNELGRRDDVVAAMYRHCALPAGGPTAHPSSGAAAAAPLAAAATDRPAAVATEAPAPAPTAGTSFAEREATHLGTHGGAPAILGAAPPAPVHAFIVLTPAAAAKFGPNFTFYHKVKGFFKEVTGPAGLAAEIGAGADAATVAAELAAYTAAAAGGVVDPHGKTVFPDPFAGAGEAADGRLYVARVCPAIHYCMGGVAMTSSAELLYADWAEADAADPAALPDLRLKGSGALALPRPPLASPQGPPVASAGGAGLAGCSCTCPSPAPGSPAVCRGSCDCKCGRCASSPFSPAADVTTPRSFSAPAILRPIPRLFGAGEVTGGVHGGNRLAGNSLLECVVFGRIAGERAAAVAVQGKALFADAFVPLTLREARPVCESTLLFRFNLPGPLQTTGMAAGQYVAVRAVIDGKECVRYYSPISRPDDLGHIDLLLKVDAGAGGCMTTHVAALKPGQTLEFKGPLGALALDFCREVAPAALLGRIKLLGLIAGGTGIAPMCQLLRSAFYHNRSDVDIRLLYSAARPNQFAFLDLLRHKTETHTNFRMALTVDAVPEGTAWDEGVGFINEAFIKAHMHPPSDDLLIVICGPYPMCMALKKLLPACGYAPEMFFSYM